MASEKFEEICDFNICEDEREKNLNNYKAIFYSESKLEIIDPEIDNWHYSEVIEQEYHEIMIKRHDEFNSDEYDYSAEVIIKYQITDKSSDHTSGDMEYHIKKLSKNKEEFEKKIKEISVELNSTFKEKVIIMYDYKVFSITLDCNFYVI